MSGRRARLHPVPRESGVGTCRPCYLRRFTGNDLITARWKPEPPESVGLQNAQAGHGAKIQHDWEPHTGQPEAWFPEPQEDRGWRLDHVI
ncbi:MAG: hypothetical protein P8189_11885, partial [Anaerolineae bacterium]